MAHRSNLTLSIAVFGAALSPAVAAQPPALIPLPAQLKWEQGTFSLTPSTRVFVDAKEGDAGRLLSHAVFQATGFKLDVRRGARPHGYTGGIELAIDPSLSRLGKEGYTLSVSSDGVIVKAFESAGLFYGVQTLRQLLPLRRQPGATEYAISALTVEDQPRFGRRGFMLDSSRHMVWKKTVLALLDALAFAKINTFHWHLVDNNAWRLYVSKYPDLVKPLDIKADWYQQAQGHYSPADVREVVEKARRLHITIVPEIEMPGHAMQAASVLPETACLKADGTPLPAGATTEICLGSDKAIAILQDILVETMALFPDSPVIHLGGDEAEDARWRACPRCQARMKELGITDARLLQKWFMEKMNRFVLDHGRRSIAWGDRLELGIPENQIVHGWHAGELEYAVAKGYQAVQSQHDYTYFDYGQGPGDTMFGGANLRIDRVYALDPVRGLPADQAARVLGPQAQLWSELVWDDHVFVKTFPRILALAEVGWTPQPLRDYKDFAERLKRFLPRLDALGIPYYKQTEAVAGSWKPAEMSEDWKELEWDVTPYVKDNGKFQAEFLYQSGAHALEIASAILLENGVEIGKDEHLGRTGAAHRANTYRFAALKPKAGATYTLRARVRSDGGTDSSGVILVR